MLFGKLNIDTDKLNNPVFSEKGISVSVTRLDKIHPVVSGNKLFKLHYFLEEALLTTHKTILTFGGAYSNHLVATAFACKKAGLNCIGIVRGERAENLSHTMNECIALGMKLKFFSRTAYKKKNDDHFIQQLMDEFGNCVIVPEGGYHQKGASGASLINQYIESDTTHICSAIGSATTIAGLLLGSSEAQKIIGITALKGFNDINERITFLTGNVQYMQKLTLLNEFHFGGFAKKNAQLTNFMNQVYTQYKLPTDFVYTAKMMFAVTELIHNGFFPEGSKINCIHTGGLQGNGSLPQGTLIY